MYQVYLCVNDNNYCHIVFDTLPAASFWCQKHPEYHVIIRNVNFHQPNED